MGDDVSEEIVARLFEFCVNRNRKKGDVIIFHKGKWLM